MPQNVVAWVTQNTPELARSVAVVNIQPLAHLVFRYATNHARVIFKFSQAFPTLVRQPVPQLQLLCFAVSRSVWVVLFVLLVTWLAAGAHVAFPRPFVKKQIEVGFRLFATAVLANFSHDKNPQRPCTSWQQAVLFWLTIGQPQYRG